MASKHGSSISALLPLEGGAKDLVPLGADARAVKRDLLKRWLVRVALIASGVAWVSDLIYKYVNDISFINREQCILYRALPPFGFVIFEYLFETMVIVFLGIFLAVLLGRWFLRFRRFYPRNPVTAFLCGSVIPVCACAAIPLLSSMKGKMKFSTTMAFVLAAPLLSPYIIVLSFSVLGFAYGMLRIACSFVLVMTSAFLVGMISRRDMRLNFEGLGGGGCSQICGVRNADVYLETYRMFKTMVPFLFIAAALGVLLEILGPRTFLLTGGGGEGVAGVLTWILVGIPLYFCNGAEVLFLRPLVSHGFPLGTAVAFSLTSTVICTTSVAMLLRSVGFRLTLILTASVVSISLTLALLLNSIT